MRKENCVLNEKAGSRFESTDKTFGAAVWLKTHKELKEKIQAECPESPAPVRSGAAA